MGVLGALSMAIILRRFRVLEERSLCHDDIELLLRPEQLEAQVRRILDSDQRILASTTETFGQIRQELGGMQEASSQLLQIGRDVAGLEQLLKPPQLRGGVGETLLATLLSQVLAHDQYELQHRFSDNQRVDAAIRVGDSLVPVDAKFPIEAFRRVLDADSDDAKSRARKEFLAAVKKHVGDIAGKYIRPDEGTFDFALMYVPAENVYYEAVMRDTDGDLFNFSLSRRVIPVSPNSLYAYLLVIAHGLRGMRIEERAREILGILENLQGDLDRFDADYQVLGTHIKNAQTKYDESGRRLRKVEDRLASATATTLPELPDGRAS